MRANYSRGKQKKNQIGRQVKVIVKSEKNEEVINFDIFNQHRYGLFKFG